MNWVKVAFLGDSLTSGARDPHGLCWPIYMCQMVMDEASYLIAPTIDAVPGRTSSELIRQVKIDALDVAEAYVLIGTNDAKDSVNIPVEQYVSNVRLLVAWLEMKGIRVYVMTIPVPSGFASPAYTVAVADRVRAYNAALRKAKFKHLVELCDVRDTTDGVHLTLDSAITVAAKAWVAMQETRTMGGPDK